MPKTLVLVLVLWLAWPGAAWGEPRTERFPSGMLSRFEEDGATRRLPEAEAVTAFLQAHFPAGPYQWRLTGRFQDATHAHLQFALYLGSREVIDHRLKVHYALGGWVQYASSTWEWPLEEAPPAVRGDRAEGGALRWAFRRQWEIEGVRSEGVLWASEGRVQSARLVRVSRKRGVGALLVVSEDGEVLENRRVERRAEAANKVYLNSPLASTTKANVTLTGLVDLDTLVSKHVRVRRHQNESDPELVDISPTTDFSAAGGFSELTSGYAHTCTGTSTQCPNQGFEGVNVYYHLESFRQRVDALLEEIGETTGPLDRDPLPVIINGYLDDNGDGCTDRNNARYISAGCPTEESNTACLIFHRPASVDEDDPTNDCVDGAAVLNPIAREASVVVHEYQHYVTDKITGFLSSGAGTVVADALHEGYSDYFGASQVSRLNGFDVTNIGEYFLQNAPSVQREIGSIFPYANVSESADEHYSGISWASGLWQLRRVLGVDYADKLALKSLFLAPNRPSFFDAVESLARADVALSGGVNRPYIRNLFYNQIKFLGGATPPFNADNKLVDVGLNGCASVPRGAAAGWGWLWALWGLGLWGLGRRWVRGARP